MKIVLLPGMDGTGKLFEPCRSLLPWPTLVIPLPQIGLQTYEALLQYVIANLPDEDFIVVAESFSGPIAASLATKNLKKLKGLIFVATFLSCPRPVLLSFAKLIPLKTLLDFIVVKPIVSWGLLGGFDYATFVAAVREVPALALKQRLDAIHRLSLLEEGNIELPALYLRASSDFLVPNKQVDLFKKKFMNLYVENIQGTHFLLQSNPKASSDIIGKFLDFLSK